MDVLTAVPVCSSALRAAPILGSDPRAPDTHREEPGGRRFPLALGGCENNAFPGPDILMSAGIIGAVPTTNPFSTNNTDQGPSTTNSQSCHIPHFGNDVVLERYNQTRIGGL